MYIREHYNHKVQQEAEDYRERHNYKEQQATVTTQDTTDTASFKETDALIHLLKLDVDRNYPITLNRYSHVSLYLLLCDPYL